MPTTLILGGSGKVARHLTRLLTTSNPAHTVHSVIRNESQIPELKSLGAQPIVQSIESAPVPELTATITSLSPDYIVWSAGAGGGNPERTQAVDHEGAVKCIDAAAAAGKGRRYIVVSALDVRDREKGWPGWYGEADQERSDKVWGVIGKYMSAKFAADKELRVGNARRGLKYTIVRPGGLSNEPGTGTVNAGKVPLGNMVSREDVASTVLQCMKDEGTIGLAFDVVGGDTKIEDAVGKVSKEKIDTFEGFY